MATETLTCETCGNSWDRERVRGRKPKECPDCKSGSKPATKASKDEGYSEVLLKSEHPAAPETLEGLGPQVIDIETGKRDEKKVVKMDIEIPEGSRINKEGRIPFYLAKYGHAILDDVSFKAGDTVTIDNHEHRGCKFRLDYITKNTNPKIEADYKVYFEMVGIAGFCTGKYRVADPWRIKK